MDCSRLSPSSETAGTTGAFPCWDAVSRRAFATCGLRGHGSHQILRTSKRSQLAPFWMWMPRERELRPFLKYDHICATSAAMS